MPVMLCGMDIDTLAETVRRRRIDRGWSVEEAARRAGINRITYARIEKGLPVQDVKRAAVEKLMDLDRKLEAVADGNDVAALAAGDLNPDLAEFTDHELLEEIERRMLLLAGRLTASGTDLLAMSVDQDGQRRIVSHTTKGR